MSWVKDLADFAKQLLTVEKRVEDNAKAIQELSQELKLLTDFSKEIARAVKSNEVKADGDYKLLVAQVQNALLQLENKTLANQVNQDRLNSSNPIEPG